MIVIEIRCDDCDCCGDSGTARAHNMRTGLKKLGWRNVGAKDYCPSCQPHQAARRNSQ